jgi:hypothetical protein
MELAILQMATGRYFEKVINITPTTYIIILDIICVTNLKNKEYKE